MPVVAEPPQAPPSRGVRSDPQEDGTEPAGGSFFSGTAMARFNPFRAASMRESRKGSRAADHGTTTFSKYEDAKYMHPAAATWLPMTFLNVVVVFVVLLIAGIVALDYAGEWAEDTTSEVNVTACPGEYDAFTRRDCSGVDFASGAPATYTFASLSPYERWLRVNLHLRAGPELVHPHNATVVFHVTIQGRSGDADQWETLVSSQTTKELLCPPRSLLSGSPCEAFNVAFYEGLSREYYRVVVAVAPESTEQTREWLRGVVLSSVRGKALLGMLDVGLRILGTVITLAALVLFLGAMWPFPRQLWLSNQKTIAGYLVCLLLYNNPVAAALLASGSPDVFFPTVFHTIFIGAGSVLALVLLDTRHMEEEAEAARAFDDSDTQGGESFMSTGANGAADAPSPGSGQGDGDALSLRQRSERSVASMDLPEVTEEEAVEADSLDAFGARSVTPFVFWWPKLALGSLVFAAALVLETFLFVRELSDPGATYSSTQGWEVLYALEGATALAWLVYASRLALMGVSLASEEYLRLKRDAEAGILVMDRAHVSMSKGYMATAGVFVLTLLGIHLREVVRTRASDHPNYSDTAYRTALQNRLVANVMGVGLAYCFKPSASTQRIHAAGGLRKALEQGKAGLGVLTSALSAYRAVLGKRVGKELKKRVPSKLRSVKARQPPPVPTPADTAPSEAATAANTDPGGGGAGEAAAERLSVGAELRGASSATDGHMLLTKFLHMYALKMRAAWRKGGDESVLPTERAELESLQHALEQLPQTSRHVNHIKWKYPVFFTSCQQLSWAIVVKDVQSAQGRAYWASKHPELARESARDATTSTRTSPQSLAEQGAARADASLDGLLRHLTKLDMAFETRAVQSQGGLYTLVLLRSSSVGVKREHVRHHAERRGVELDLAWEAPSPITSADKTMAISRLLTEHPMPGQSHAGLPEGSFSLVANGVELIATSFPLHDRELNSALHAQLRTLYTLTDEQLTALRNHYGEEIAFYYAFLNFSCNWLAPIAALGVLFFLLQYSDAEGIYELLYVVFASMSVIWGAFVYVFWRRRARELALLWDVSSFDDVEDINPNFKGFMVPDKVRGGHKPYVPAVSRVPALLHTALQMLIQMVILVILEYCVYSHWVWLHEEFDLDDTQQFEYFFHSYIVNALLYIVLIMYGQYVLWSIVAHWCTRLENWESRRKFDRNYVAYVFAFIWLDGYMWSLIIGFVHIPLVEWFQSNQGDLREVVFPLWGNLFRTNAHDADYWMARHDSTIIAMLSVNQIAGLVAENVAPVIAVLFVRRFYLRSHTQTDATDAASGVGAQVASATNGVDASQTAAKTLAPPPPSEDVDAIAKQAIDEWWLWEFSTQDDYFDTALFIGYIATYTVIWPLTSLMSWVNNHIELRTDLIKINRAWRRCVPRRAAGIGSWQPALGFSIVASVILVTGFATISTRHSEVFFRFAENPVHPLHDEFWNDETGHVYMAYRVLVLVTWEHLLAIIILLIYFFVPPLTERQLETRHLKIKHRAAAERREVERTLAAATGKQGTPRAKSPGGSVLPTVALRAVTSRPPATVHPQGSDSGISAVGAGSDYVQSTRRQSDAKIARSDRTYSKGVHRHRDKMD